MLSYRHAFHAGNHADVLKHVLLVRLIRYLTEKDKPFWYVDTHAGAGRYALDSLQAQKLAEHREGIGRLWPCRHLPPAVADYLELVRAANPEGHLHTYPGSPCLAAATMRPQDSLRLYELHGRDVVRLRESLAGGGKRAIVAHADGFVALKALLPPPPRRALVLIDPAYEEGRDYGRAVVALREAVSRFPGGVYMLWYPQLTKLEAHALPRRLQQLPGVKWLNVTLRIGTPPASGLGMYGSGVFIVNPPWTLEATLLEVMPFLVRVLARDGGAGFTLESRGGRDMGPQLVATT